MWRGTSYFIFGVLVPLPTDNRKRECAIASSAVVSKSKKYIVNRPEGAGYLLVSGVACLIIGVLELISALNFLEFISMMERLQWLTPWLGATLSSGAEEVYVAYFGIALAVLFIKLGVLGVVFSRSIKLAMLLSMLCVGTFAFQLVAIVVAFLAGGFSYLSIFLLVIPVLYFLGAAQNTNNRKLSQTAIAYSFIAPNLIGFSIFTLIPIVFSLGLSFVQWDLSDDTFVFVGLDNFARLLNDHLFWPSVRNTIYFTALTVPLTMILSLSLALLLNRQLRGRAIFRGIMFFPHVASLIAMAAVWNQIFHPSWGPVNQFLNFFGIESIRWTTSPWIIPNIAFFTAWRNMGYYMIIYLAGLQSIPKELYEASALDGAGKWKSFIYVTLPQLRFVTFFISVLLTIMSFRVFDQVIMIAGTENPGSTVSMLVNHVFRAAFINWDFGYASAIAMVLLVLVVTITIAQFRIQKNYENS